MKNPRLYYLLKQIGLTPEKIAADPRVMSSRAHVTECLLNKPGRGKNTRKRIALLIAPEHLKLCLNPVELARREEIMAILGWDKDGNLISPPAVPRGESQLKQTHPLESGATHCQHCGGVLPGMKPNDGIDRCPHCGLEGNQP